MNKKRWTQELMKEIFEKAKTESKIDSPNGLADYLHNEIQIHISERNLIRYYNYFIEKRKEESIRPEKGSLDILSRYLGYKNFAEYIDKNESKTALELITCQEVNVKLKRKLFLSYIIGSIFIAGMFYFILEYYRKNCMIWVEDHYEKVRCSGLNNDRALNDGVLEKMKRIYPCDTTTFFRNGEPVVWYDKSNNKMNYFTYYDMHPINGKTLKPITQDIIDVHVPLCDSTKKPANRRFEKLLLHFRMSRTIFK